MNDNETIADIVGDIRAQNQGLPEDVNALSPLVCDILRLADRIEEAAKRETHWDDRETLTNALDELAKQREYDAKLEADFSALMADRNGLAEKNRACCAENDNLKARLRAIKDAIQYDCEYGSSGAYMIDCDEYRDSWFDGIGESEVAKCGEGQGEEQ